MDLPEIPINKEITYLGITTYRDKNQLFGIKRKDRRQHVYLLGKSGTGKSVLMFNMIIQNILNGEGVCVVDPHGELVEGVLSAIPKNRMKDIVYFNPADTEHHIGFNVLELIDPKYKHLVASGLMGIFTKIWANAWSARMEYILNNCILALLDTPETTLLGIPRMLVDKDYRQKIIKNLKDPVIKAFWVHEYESWQDKFRNEAISAIQNKVGQFLSTSIIRNVVGQSVSTINIFDIMNEGKIFLVNVSKGRIGEDNSALLGGMIITKIQLAAMERVRIPEDERRDFYLYVDEFQNFVTDAFAGILSEARKYRLNLTIAHQYTAQLVSDKNSAVRDAVFGNVGTIIVFRVGSDDADFLESEFDPEFTPQDIVNLPNFKVYLKLMIDGITSRPFSAKTLPPLVKSGNKEVEEEVIRNSRERYCRPREIVEQEITDWSGMSIGDDDDLGSDGMVKFDIDCSLCKKATTVPFKPDAGRAVYCKECIAKIKSGEVKIKKNEKNQTKYDDSKFFKPLADLGIEFSEDNNALSKEDQIRNRDPILATKKTWKNKQVQKTKQNPALKEIIKKITADGETPQETVAPAVSSVAPSISLENLKEKTKEITSKDKSASSAEMDKLKDLIVEKIETKEEIPVPEKVETPTPTPTPNPIINQSQNTEKEFVPQKSQEKENVPTPPEKTSTPDEVPEDVLRKILE